MLNALKINSYIKNTLSVLVCILCVNTSYAQFDKLTEAQELMKEKRYAQAIYILEGAKSHPETKDNSHTWYLRANSYYNYYKQVGDYTDKKIALLDTATSSALMSNKLNPEDEIKLDNIKIVENVIKRYHNFYTILLRDSLNSTKSEKFYNKYKSTTLLIKPNFEFKLEDINYYNAVGSIFGELYTQTFDDKYGDVAKLALFEVLIIDPKNITANLNMGIYYYNQGAKLIREMPVDVDLVQLDVFQDNATKLLKQSLPFMSKVYELNPKEQKVLEGLEGIYHQLNDEEKALDFKRQKEELLKKK